VNTEYNQSTRNLADKIEQYLTMVSIFIFLLQHALLLDRAASCTAADTAFWCMCMRSSVHSVGCLGSMHVCAFATAQVLGLLSQLACLSLP
jgi:hypothetical protein